MKTHEAKNWGELAMILTARLRLQYICTGAADVPFQRADGSTGRRKVQTISAEIIKGQRKILGSSLFLAKSGAAEGAPMIPFQRRGKARTPIDVFKTLSVPQMLTGDLARPELEACIVEVMNERYTHNLNRHMSRYVKGKVGL